MIEIRVTHVIEAGKSTPSPAATYDRLTQEMIGNLKMEVAALAAQKEKPATSDFWLTLERIAKLESDFVALTAQVEMLLKDSFTPT